MKARARAWTLVFATGVTLAHHALRPGAETGAGPLLVLDHLFAILAAVTLMALCAAVGLRLVHVGRLPMDSDIERLAFGAALGAGTVSTLLLVCGALGGFREWVLAPGLATTAFVARRELGVLPRLLRAAAREWQLIAGVPATAVFAALAACLLVLALAPATDTDSLSYHLRVPAQFLDRGRIYLPEDNLHVAWVGLAHLLYVPLLALEAPSAPAVLNVIFALLLPLTLAPAAVRFSPSLAAGRVAPLLLAGSPVVLLVAITPKIDVTLALFLFLGHYALLRASHEMNSAARWLVASAALLGFGAGIKLLALPYIASLVPVLLLLAARGSVRVRLVVVFAAVGVATALPWLVKNWALVGAPFYPELAAPILPPWLEQIHGSRQLPASLDPSGLTPLRDVRVPFNLADWFVAPERLTPESEGRWYAANPLFALLVLAILFLRDRAMAALLAPAALYVGIAVLLGSRINLRYLVPVIPILTLAAGLVLARILDRVPRPMLRSILMAMAMAAALYAPARALARKFDERPALALAAGRISRHDYRMSARDVEIGPYARMAARVNAALPPGARLLLLFDPRGSGFAMPVLADHLMTNWPLLLPAIEPPRCLESSGISHVLVNTGTLRYLEQRGLDARRLHWDRFPGFASRCLDLLEDASDFALYRVREGPR